MKKENEQNMIEIINNNIENFDILNDNNLKIENSEKDNNKEKNKFKNNERFQTQSFQSFSSFGNSSVRSHNNSCASIAFRNDNILDLPEFNPTKYNPLMWRVIHCFFYTIFSCGFLWSNILFNEEEKGIDIKIKLISDSSLFCANFMMWLHYRRGCIGQANLESNLRTNIDKSFKAKILRSQSGWKFFSSLIGSSILIYGDVYFLTNCKELNPDFLNINLVGMMLISLSQILKIDKILTENKQYIVKNDISNCFIEIFLFFGSLLTGNSYLLQMAYFRMKETINKLEFYLLIFGNLFIIFSNISLIYRYFCSGYDDLNTSTLSNLTV